MPKTDLPVYFTDAIRRAQEDVLRQPHFLTEAMADILERNPDGPWTLEELEVLTPSVNNSGA